MAATEVAGHWDGLWYFLVGISTFFFILIVGGMLYLAIRYRRSANQKPKYLTGSHVIEALWTIIPTILLLAIFGWGYSVYNRMTNAPSDAFEVRVIGKQWLWQFMYDDGRSTIGELYVPANKPVKLVMTSEDVLHSLFIPNFRVKMDVVPGMYTSVWFETTVPGKHQIYCTEYCGTSHSGMLAQVIALEEKDWKAWRAGKKVKIAGTEEGKDPSTTGDALVKTSLADRGKEVSQTKGCFACHSDDGTTKVGPTWKGLYEHDVELADGRKVKADENYLRESIDNPTAKIVKGFNPTMPTFKGLLTEEEHAALMAYIKSLK